MAQEIEFLGLRKIPDQFEVLTVRVTRQNLEKIIRGYEQYRIYTDDKRKRRNLSRGSTRTQLPKPVSIEIIDSNVMTTDECISRGIFIHPGSKISDTTVYQTLINHEISQALPLIADSETE